MRTTIICTSENIEALRKERGNILPIELSPTGELPITHYACIQNIKDEEFEKLKTEEKYTTVSEGIEIIKQWGLKIVSYQGKPVGTSKVGSKA